MLENLNKGLDVLEKHKATWFPPAWGHFVMWEIEHNVCSVSDLISGLFRKLQRPLTTA